MTTITNAGIINSFVRTPQAGDDVFTSAFTGLTEIKGSIPFVPFVLTKGVIKMKKYILSTMAVMACFAFGAPIASADVTGDFKVVSGTYTDSGDKSGGDVTVSGNVNHGAVQSGKSVIVDVSFDYSFEYQITTITGTVNCVKTKKNGVIQVVGNGACTNANFAQDNAYWLDQTVKTTIKVTANGMKAVTAPTVMRDGRLNPKGKITGYDWNGIYSIVPVDSIVDPALVPTGATFVSGSVQITGVSYITYLIDKDGFFIIDTVVFKTLFPVL